MFVRFNLQLPLSCHLMAGRTLYEADCFVFVTARGHNKLVIYQTGGHVRSAEGGEYGGYWESQPASKFGQCRKGIKGLQGWQVFLFFSRLSYGLFI
jgi:hypothetical protein